jgi:multisubunit Na+/H+ antiporter MnhG subunit
MISYKRQVLLCYIGGAGAGLVMAVLLVFSEPASSRLETLLSIPLFMLVMAPVGGLLMHLRLFLKNKIASSVDEVSDDELIEDAKADLKTAAHIIAENLGD